MLSIRKDPKFEKDIKAYTKKHYNFNELMKVIILLQSKSSLPNKYKNHFLKGDMQGLQECHIEKDVLLIYYIIDNELVLHRFGSHSDLLAK